MRFVHWGGYVATDVVPYTAISVMCLVHWGGYLATDWNVQRYDGDQKSKN